MNVTKFNIVNFRYTGMKRIALDPYCNLIMVTNVGGAIAYVNDYPIHPSSDPANINGEAFVMGGLKDEVIHDPTFTIKFDPAGPNPAVIVTQKVYLTGNE